MVSELHDTTCKCATCGREQRVSFAYCLENGWPECCSLTMWAVGADPEVIEKAIRRVKQRGRVNIAAWVQEP